MVAISEQTIDKVLHISDEQIPLLTNFVDELINNDVSSIDVSNRIGIAKDISFPADFDDIDYGSLDLFGLNS